MCMNVHTCAHTHIHTHTHTHTVTQRGLVPLAVTLVLISHTKCTCAWMYTPVHTHMTHTYMHTHTHTHTDWACTTCSDIGLLFLTLYLQSMYMCKKTLAHCYVNSPYTIFITNTYTHIHTHTHMCTHTRTCTHTDWACNACSDFGFLFLTLSLQSVHVHECIHMCTCTHTQRLRLYHLQSFYKAYMCMIEHTYTNVHTHSTTCSDLWFFCHCFHKVYMCMNVHTCAHTLLCTQPVHHIFVTHTAHTHTVHLHRYRNGILCTTHTNTHVQRLW